MSKKLILFLMLAVFGSTNLLKADEVTIGDPAGKDTDANLPVCSLANYTVTQQIYTAEEIGRAGTINSFTMWLKNSSSYSRDVKIYMKNVNMDAFEFTGSWAKMSEADLVATGRIVNGVSSPEAVTFTLNTPFEYDGESNLVICFADVTGSWEYGVAGVTFQGEKYRAICYTSSDAIDITNIPASNVPLRKYRNVVSLDITPAPVPFDVTPKDFGPRPNNAWMEPATFEVLGTGYNVTVMNIDNDYFTFDGHEVPFTTPATFAVTTGNADAGEVTGHVAFIYEGSRGNARFDIKATAYDPTEGDVVEKVKIVPAGFSTYMDQPSEIYHNYNLPGEDSDNPDAVYRLNFYNLPKDVLLTANIEGGDRGEGKVALYKEEADGTCHPMRDNAYEYAGMYGGKTLDGNGMYVEKGGIYYLVAQAEDGFTVNINALNAPAPGKPEVTYPTDGSSISPDNVTAKWNIGEFTTEIRVLLKPVYEDDWATIQDWTPCITETGTLDEVQLSNLEEGTSYNLRVDARNAADEVESDVVTFNTTASAPTNLSVNKNGIFEGDEVTFNWNYTISSELFIGYNIYCDGDPLNLSPITTKSFNYTFEPGTYNMDPGYEITVKAVFSNGTESAASEPISVNVSGYANFVSGAVYYDIVNPKLLAGATVTFTGKDEFKNDVTFTTESNEYGLYEFSEGSGNGLKAGSYTATAELSGLSYIAKIEVPLEFEYANIYGQDFEANMNLPAPEDLTASNDEVFEGETVTFSWDYTASSQLFVGYYLYIDGNKYPIQEESIPCRFDTYNMDGYEITVKAAYKNGEIEYESAASEPATVKVSGYAANVSGTVYCDLFNLLAGATVTFTGEDEFGNNVTFTTESNENGAYAFNEGSGKRLKAGSYTATAELSTLYRAEITGSIDVEHNDDIDEINFDGVMTLPAPEDLMASNDEVFEGDKVTFSWSFNPTSDLFSGFNFYVDGAKENTTLIDRDKTDYAYTFGVDSYNMDDGHKITVKAVYTAVCGDDGVEYESAASQPATVKVSGNGIVAGNVYDCNEGTPLEGVKLTLNGLDEFGDPVVLTTTTGDDGIFVSDIKAGTYAVRASLDGFEDVTWERPIRFTYQQETSLDNICMHEMYYAPSSVVAEEIDHQKVVKVEWDMNRSLQNFNIWIRKTAGEDIEPGGAPEKSLLEGNYSAVSSTWYDNLWETKDRGVYQYGVEALYGGTMGSGSGEAGELTVYDGDYNLNPGINPDGDGSTIPDNHYFPFYVLRANNYTKSNMIMPAADLADMKDCEITSMKFYYERPKNDTRLCDTPWKVWLKEVSETEPSEPYDMSLVDPVYDNYIEFLNGKYELVITLREPFEYHGGNLLIAVQNEVGEDYGVVAFAGNENRDNQCSACGYGETEDFDFNHTSKFLPKTTFSYRKHITWSNTLEKDMNKESFTFKVSTSEEGGSVDGARVTMTNVSEPWINKLVFSMEATGEYQIANFRRGVYNIEVKPADGDHDAFTEVNVNLWDASEYPVVLKETELEVKNVYVSHTGFARWDKWTVKDRGFNGYDLYVDERQVETMYADTCYQIDCTELAIGSHKFTVEVVQNTGRTPTDKEFEYLGCDNFNPELVGGYHTPQAVAECHDVVVTWGEEESSDLKYNFDDGTLQGWTAIDAGWEATDKYGAHSGDYTASPTTVGTYLVSPLVALGEHAEISFYSKKTDQDVELSVLVSTGTDFIDLQSADELGLISVFWDDFICKSTLFLSDYAGQQVCLAFLNIIGGIIPIDDITITNASEVKQWDVTTWALYLDDEPRGNVSGDTRYYNLTIDDNEEHTFRVVGIDAEYNMSCGDEVTFTAGSTNTPSGLKAEGIEGGVKLTWEGYSDKYKVYKGFAADNMILLGTVEDGATEFVDVQVLQGCYYGVSGLSDDCGESDEMTTTEFGETEAMYYTPEPGYFSATMDVTGYVSINNEDPLNSNFEIGAFITDGYGVRHCCGGARSLYYPAENHNIFKFEVHGNSENDVITFELYDHSTGEVLDYLISKTTLNFEVGGSAGTIEDPSVFKFFSTDEHCMDLAEGYNWVSTFIELSGEEGLDIIKEGLGENAEKIGSIVAFTQYSPASGKWYGSLKTAESEEMYVIKMSETAHVCFTGMVADPEEHSVTLVQGWNWIGFISGQEMDLATALRTITPSNGDIIKSHVQQAEYHDGRWYGSLETMESGQGYKYKRNGAEQQLTYPVATRVESVADNASAADSHWTADASRFAMNMSVTAAVSVDGSLVENGDIEVGAFCNGEVRGSARPVYVEALDRHVIFLTVFGNEGDNITFRLFNAEDGSEYTAAEYLVYSDDAIKGGIEDPFMLNFGGDDNISVFPNPTKGNVIVSADGMKNISVVNTLGQTVYRQAANAGEMTIDMSQFGAGMYLINIETENGTTVKHITVTR